jgi:hypothetical protein
MSHETEVDYEIMKSLNSLLHIELQDSEPQQSFSHYREQSKALLTKMLAKLEDNDEYQRYLESEVKRLEDNVGFEEEKECARMQVWGNLRLRPFPFAPRYSYVNTGEN